MKKFTLFFMSLFLTIGAMAQIEVLGVKNIPTERTDLTNIKSGYYLLKQVNNHTNAAGGQGVGWIKAASEGNDQSITSKNTGTPDANGVTYVWYIEVVDAENNLITISTANKIAAWQSPWQFDKELVPYTDRATLKYHTGTVNLSGDATPNEGSCFISNSETTAFVHFSGDVLGSWNDTNYTSMFMVEFYYLSNENLMTRARLNFDTAYAQAAELLEKAEATYEKIQLTTTEGEDGYIWTNAQSAAEGPIANLIDGSEDYVNSYFHTAWGSETITPNPGYHFFEIDLGEGNSLSDFAFDYTTRKDKNGVQLAGMPNVVEIYGSNGNDPADATSYSLIAKITDGLPSGGYDQGIKYESENILVNDSYRHIRIRMNKGNSFFMAAEFNIYNAVYDAKYNSLRELYKVHKNNSSYDTESLKNATNEINNAINAILYPPFTLNVTGAGYSTLYLDYPAEIPTFAGEDAGAYIITGVKEGNWLELVKVEGVLPANQGIVVKADEGNYTFNYSTATTAIVEGNLLRGTVVDEEIEKAETNSYYVLANEDGIGFYNPILGDDTSKFKNSANKAYLVISKDMTQSASLRFDFGGTTAIEEMTEQRAESEVIFDLIGRRVEAVTVPGVYIVNGKKVLVK